MTVVAGRGRWPLMGGSRVNRHNVTGLTGSTAPAPVPLPTPMLAEYAFDPTTDFPDLITELSPTTDPLAMPTWSRLHDSHRAVNRLSALSLDTGRQRETDVFQPGTATHELDNHDRVLDPKYVAGALDTFNGSDLAASLGDAEFGGTWVQQAGVWARIGGTARLVSGANGLAVLPLLADGTFQVTLPTTQDTAGISFRDQDSANFWLFITSAFFAGYALYKTLAGVETWVNAGGAPAASGDVLKVVTAGASISCYVNGVLLFAPDVSGDLRSAKLGGLGARGGATTARWNDFSFVAAGSPGATASPYAGHLDPGNRIRDRAVWGSRTYELYTGFALGYPQRYRPPASASCTIAAADLLDLLGGSQLEGGAYPALVAARPSLWAWYRLAEASGTTGIDDGPNGLDGSYRNSPTLGVSGLIAGESDTAATFGSASYLGVSSAASLTGMQWGIECLASHATATAIEVLFDQSFGVITLQMNANGTLTAQASSLFVGPITLTTATRIDDSAAHLIAFFADNTTLYITIDGVIAASTPFTGLGVGIAGPITIGASLNGTLSWTGVLEKVSLYTTFSPTSAKESNDAWLGWPNELTGARAHRIANLVGIAQAERSIDAGLTTMAATSLSGSELGYLQLIEATEQGQLFVDHENGAQLRLADRYRRILEVFSTVPQAVFTDDPASTTGYRYEPGDLVVTRDKQLIFNDITVTWAGGSVRVKDATSRRRHGRRSRTINTELPTADQAGALGRCFLTHYKDPIDRILSLTLRPSADKRLFDVALGLKAGHLVTVELQPQGIGNRTSQNVIVEGKHHDISTGVNVWSASLYVSNADVRSYFRPGVSSPGGTDGPAY